MKLAVTNASIIQIDLKMHTDGILRGYVLAYISGDAWRDPSDDPHQSSADYVTWRVQYAPIADTEVDCESGNYFHLSPGWTDDQQCIEYARAKADFNDRRSVQVPPF